MCPRALSHVDRLIHLGVSSFQARVFNIGIFGAGTVAGGKSSGANWGLDRSDANVVTVWLLRSRACRSGVVDILRERRREFAEMGLSFVVQKVRGWVCSCALRMLRVKAGVVRVRQLRNFLYDAFGQMCCRDVAKKRYALSTRTCHAPHIIVSLCGAPLTPLLWVAFSSAESLSWMQELRSQRTRMVHRRRLRSNPPPSTLRRVVNMC